jgi:hypothetical protein
MKNKPFATSNLNRSLLKTRVTNRAVENGEERFKHSPKIKKLLFVLLVQFAFLNNSFATISGAATLDPDINTTYNFFPTVGVDYSHAVTWSVTGPASMVSQTSSSCVIKANHIDIVTCTITLKVSYYAFQPDGTSAATSETFSISRYAFTTGPQTVYPGEPFTYSVKDPCNSPFSCNYDWSHTVGSSNFSSIVGWHLNDVSVQWPAVVPAATISSGIIGPVRCIVSCDAGGYVAYCSDYIIHMALRAPTITGAASTPCGSTATITYTANSVGATVYVWQVSSGWTIISHPTYNTIVVKPNGTSAGTISAKAYAASGSVVNSAVASKAVTLQKVTSIAGSNAMCINTTGNYTAVSTPAGLTGSFTWTTNTAGWLINGLPSPVTTTTNFVTLTAPATHGVTNLCVSSSTACSSVCYTISSAMLATPTYLATNPISECSGSDVVWDINPVPYASSYTWSSSSAGTSLTPSGTSCDIFVTGTGTKMIQVKANNACGSSAVKTQGLMIKTTGGCAPKRVAHEDADLAEPVAKENKISIYPNPASTKLSVDISSVESGNYTITLYDMLGSVIVSTKKVTDAGATNASIDISAFTNGIYFLTVDNGVAVRKEKIIINH